jgi:hypothetical protein
MNKTLKDEFKFNRRNSFLWTFWWVLMELRVYVHLVVESWASFAFEPQIDVGETDTASSDGRQRIGMVQISGDYSLQMTKHSFNLTYLISTWETHFIIHRCLTVLAFPRDSISFIIHCQLVGYHCWSWLHRRHGGNIDLKTNSLLVLTEALYWILVYF